jgi:uncharacterized protein YktA (UPF0223 family)
MYNVVSNLNVRDFITALEHVTDTTVSSGMTWLLVSDVASEYEAKANLNNLWDRYRQFQRVARQWALLKRIR